MGNEYHNYCAYQVELWHNCNNSCSFCYLNKERILLNTEQRKSAIHKTIQIIENLPPEYDAFGLIGGEFFQGQLETTELKETFKKLINILDDKVSSGRLKQVWITASLISKNQTDLYYCLKDIKNANRFLICTSYDTNGRFKDFTERETWFLNVETVKKLSIPVHVQVITTSYFIEEALQTNILQRLKGLTSVDFKLPTPQREYYLHILDSLSVEEYRRILKNTMTDSKFFIQDRKLFFKFLNLLKDIFGSEKLKAFASNEVRSKTLNILTKDIILQDRWTETAKENAPCGHPWDSYCYLDSNKCTRCDALLLLED